MQSPTGTKVFRKRTGQGWRKHEQAIIEAENWCHMQASKMPTGTRKFVGYRIHNRRTGTGGCCRRSESIEDLAEEYEKQWKPYGESDRAPLEGEMMYWEC